MSRGVKKFLYGLLYFACASLIVFFVYKSYTTIPPTCFDNIQNQTETGIDCGGSCIACDIKNLIPLNEVGAPRVFAIPGTDGELVVFEVQNQNTSHHAMQFTYTINILDKNNIVVETLEGTDALFAGEKRFIFEPRITTPVRNIGNISFEFSDVAWRRADEYVPPALMLSDITTEVGNNALRVNGLVKNGNTFSAGSVKLIAILRGKSGMDLFAAQVILTSIPGFGSTSFTIPFPFDKTLIDGLDPKGTQVFVSSK